MGQDGPHVLNQKLKVLWIGSGREDKTVSFSSIQSFAYSLTEKKVKHVFNPSGGGHSWPNWQVYLSKYAPLLFRDWPPFRPALTRSHPSASAVRRSGRPAVFS